MTNTALVEERETSSNRRLHRVTQRIAHCSSVTGMLALRSRAATQHVCPSARRRSNSTESCSNGQDDASSTTSHCGSRRTNGGSCSVPTAAGRRRCCASPQCTSIRRRAPSACSARRSAEPTCDSSVVGIGYASAALATQFRQELAAARRRHDRQVRGPRTVVAPLRRVRPRPGIGLPGTDGGRRPGRPFHGDAVVGRAAAGTARPHTDERSRR